MRMFFPWPDRHLMPNRKYDHRALTPIRARAREDAFFLTKQALERYAHPGAGVLLQLHLEFRPPDRRIRDDDNLYLAFKSYRDGMFQALGLDDHLVKRTILEWGPIAKDGEVVVELTVL